MHPFSPLLISIQGLEPCCRAGNTLHDGRLSYHTAFCGKDADGDSSERCNKRRAADSAVEEGLLQLLYLLNQADGVERLHHLGQLLSLLGRQYA